MEEPNLNPDPEAAEEALLRALFAATPPEPMRPAAYGRLLAAVQAQAAPRPVAVRPLINLRGWWAVALAAVALLVLGLLLPAPERLTVPAVSVEDRPLDLAAWALAAAFGLLALDRWLRGMQRAATR